jgi:hypothetical protein
VRQLDVEGRLASMLLHPPKKSCAFRKCFRISVFSVRSAIHAKMEKIS